MVLFHIDIVKHQSNSDRSMDSDCSTLINPLCLSVREQPNCPARRTSPKLRRPPEQTMLSGDDAVSRSLKIVGTTRSWQRSITTALGKAKE